MVTPVDPVADPSFIKYAVTEGGLLAVCLVLIYFLKREHELARTALQERIAVLADLVGQSQTAIAHGADAIADAISKQALAVEQITRFIERMDTNLTNREHTQDQRERANEEQARGETARRRRKDWDETHDKLPHDR